MLGVFDKATPLYTQANIFVSWPGKQISDSLSACCTK